MRWQFLLWWADRLRLVGRFCYGVESRGGKLRIIAGFVGFSTRTLPNTPAVVSESARFLMGVCFAYGVSSRVGPSTS